MSGKVTPWPADADRVVFRLHDPIGHPEFAWPRTLLRFAVRWQRPSVRVEELRLADDTGKPVPFQPAEVVEEDGLAVSAVICFFGALAPGQTRAYVLSGGTPAVPDRPVRVTSSDEHVVLDSGALQVRLPASQAADGVAPGPVTAWNRGRGWVGRSEVRGGVERVGARLVESGPLFADYEIVYDFAHGARYTATVRCLQGCDFVEISEEMAGFDDAGASWELSWTGCSPTHRFSSAWPGSQNAADHLDPESPETYRWLGIDEPLTLGGSGEDPNFSGPGGTERPDEDYLFTIGPYGPSFAWGVRPHAAFWDVRTDDAMAVFIRDHARWDDRSYASWASSDLLQIRFRHAEGVLRWTWPLRTGTRSTGIACYDHEQDREVLRRQEDGAAYQSTYARDLQHRQGTLSLDRVKDWNLAYDGRRPGRVAAEGEFATTGDFLAALFEGDEGPRLIARGVNDLAGYLNIGQRPLYDRFLDGYDRLGERLSAEQRRRVDALLLLTAYVSANEEMTPILRMFGGHPNFLADGKAALACLAWLFPDHEAAPAWLDQFGKAAELAARFHTRPALPGRESSAGRWTESLSTYVWAFLRPMTLGNALARRTDGRNRLATPEFAAVGDWLVNALTAPILTRDEPTPGNGASRLHPAQGAHAFWPRRPPIEMRLLGEALRAYRPLVAEHLLWGGDASAKHLDSRPGAPDPWRPLVESAGNAGTNPRLRSSKYTGYGVTLRADVDRPSEVAVFLQQVDHGPNYRWGVADDNGSGHIYYYAAGRAYSGHGPEDAGDRRVPDATFTTSCAVWQDGAFRSIGQNTLDRPFHDLGWAQFAELVPHADSPVALAYRSRSVLLMGADYIATYDAFAPHQRTVWTWSTLTKSNGHDANSFACLPDRMPFVHVVRGVRRDGELDGEMVTPTSRILRLEGRPEGGDGDTLAIVSHRDDLTVDPEATTPWGARIRTPHSVDHVFRYEREVDVAEDGLRFRGTAGAIRLRHDGRRQLALFHGTLIGAGDVTLTTGDPELGISLDYREPRAIEGTYVTRRPAKALLRVAGGLGDAEVFVDGAPARAFRVSDEELSVELPEGRHRWELTEGAPRPVPSRVVRTESVSGGAVVHFTRVAAAGSYAIQLSTDNGTTWETVGSARRSPYPLHGLTNGAKYHVRVVAGNGTRRSDPGPDYPIYATGERPPAPDGLKLRPADGSVTATWGEVLGASRYRLYRRRKGDVGFREVFAGLAFSHRDDVAGVVPGFAEPSSGELPPGITVYEYAVAAENGNGVGPESPPVDTDPRSWRHWEPPVEAAFRRQHTYNQPPYTLDPVTPAHYDRAEPPAALPVFDETWDGR
ncbi:fibronectin type III domain-containing protein [Nonomuraea sp. NPDC000554]|uniref:fibronectin type III domain-containing protein n=1 Tax=Nonomuraea sp. NPDC000554 TaxID=3154259 RepID=UPI0033168761